LKILLKVTKMPDQNKTSEKKIIKKPSYADILCGMGENRVMFRWVWTFFKTILNLYPRWRSSLWKLLWQELLAYTATFIMISMVYRYTLSMEQQVQLEKLIRWCRHQSTGLLRS
jgi:hypothetical protein